MTESPRDKLLALALAVGVHLACVLVVALGLLWTRKEAPLSIAGSVIEATLVAQPPPSASKPARAPAPTPEPAAPKPQPQPEPKPQRAEAPPQPQPQAPLPRPDLRETERAARLAEQQAEKARREEQERRRQEQVLLDEKQRQEAERRERLRRQELEREQQLAELRRQREEAERRRRIEQEKLQQLADRRSQSTPAPAPTRDAPPADRLGNEGRDDSLKGRYALAIQQAVTQAWLRPETTTSVQCRVRIIQIPGGEVISVTVLPPCPTDDLTRRSFEAAVLKAQPLPYRGYESVFSREVTATFCYPRDRCQ